MSDKSLIEAIRSAPLLNSTVKAKANEIIGKYWGECEFPPTLRCIVEKAIYKAQEEGDNVAIYADLERFLSKQKQSQNLSQDHCL